MTEKNRHIAVSNREAISLSDIIVQSEIPLVVQLQSNDSLLN